MSEEGDRPAPEDIDGAIDWYVAKLKMSDEELAALRLAAGKDARKLAKLAHLALVNDVWVEADAALLADVPYEEFGLSLVDKLANAWAAAEEPGFRLGLVFRNAVQNAYSAGRYAQMTDPDVLESRPYWKFDAILDDRTSDICKAAHGTVRPANDAWFAAHYPPCHHNAVEAGTSITTARGEVRVADVMPGDVVLTHSGSWRAVYAVLNKIETRPIRELHLASGQVLRITHEHPVLVHSASHGPVWRAVADLQAGDELFHYSDEVGGFAHDSVCHPSNAPPLADEPSISGYVAGGPGETPVPLTIDLQAYPGVDESEVDDVISDGVLSYRSREKAGDRPLRWGHFITKRLGPPNGCRGSDARHAHRVSQAHPLRCHSVNATPVVVRGSTPLGHCLRLSAANGCLVGPLADSYPVPLAPCTERGLADAKTSLDGANAFAADPVFLSDESVNERPVSKINWHPCKIAYIEESSIKDGHFCDLSVEEDETYVAAGVIVHNCRSTVITLRKSAASQVSDKPTGVAAGEGFGSFPQDRTYVPDSSGYPGALWSIFKSNDE